MKRADLRRLMRLKHRLVPLPGGVGFKIMHKGNLRHMLVTPEVRSEISKLTSHGRVKLDDGFPVTVEEMQRLVDLDRASRNYTPKDFTTPMSDAQKASADKIEGALLTALSSEDASDAAESAV